MTNKQQKIHRDVKHSFIHSLRLKIIAGYIFLIGLLVMIGLVMRNETDKLIAVRNGELQREESRKLINHIAGKLMDITFPGELLPLWSPADFLQYKTNNRDAIEALDNLKTFYPNHTQCSRIDSVCYLLNEKEAQLGKLYELLRPKDSNPNNNRHLSPSYTDSLKRKNEELNYRLDYLIHDFEREAVHQAQIDQERQYHIRQSSFYIFSYTMVVASLSAIFFYILIHRDIRKKADYRRKIEEANRNNQQLLSLHRRMVLSILHDLRSPLGIVSGYAELAKGEPDNGKREMQIDSILASSGYMLSLTENLLVYYKLDTEGEQAVPIPFQPDRFIQEVESCFRPQTEDKGITFIVDYVPNGFTLNGDRERLYRIVSNILSNAIKFTTAGNITISMRYKDGNLFLEVQDTGFGMSTEDISRIFNAFERLGRDGEVSGFGLGLSITNGLISLLGGTIEVESQLNIGSLFKVTLPMLQTDTTVKEKPINIENHSLSYPMRILLIDDDPMQLMLMREMLRRHNITCDCCDRADEVMERLESQRYDLLITDIQMPITDGFALLKMLRESDILQANTISVLAMTARIDLNEDDYIAKGFAGCLFKPVTLSTLMRTITGQDCLVANGEDVSFSLVLHEEKNPPEMLELFISETRKNMAVLRDAIEHEDAETLSFILHKITSLWSTLGVHVPRHPKPEEYPAIFRQGEWMVRRATQLYHSLTDNTAEYEEDTNHRG